MQHPGLRSRAGPPPPRLRLPGRWAGGGGGGGGGGDRAGAAGGGGGGGGESGMTMSALVPQRAAGGAGRLRPGRGGRGARPTLPADTARRDGPRGAGAGGAGGSEPRTEPGAGAGAGPEDSPAPTRERRSETQVGGGDPRPSGPALCARGRGTRGEEGRHGAGMARAPALDAPLAWTGRHFGWKLCLAGPAVPAGASVSPSFGLPFSAPASPPPPSPLAFVSLFTS